MTFNGGLVISNGSRAPEEGFDCDRSDNMKVNGGTLIGIGGSAIAPSSAGKQNTVVYNGLEFTKGNRLAILDSEGKHVATYLMPRSLNGSLFFSTPGLKAGATYTLSQDGELSSATYSWNGWSSGGSWSGGSQTGTGTVQGAVTTVSISNGPGGGGGPGGRP